MTDPNPIRAWLDDDLVDRKAPAGWVQVTTAARPSRCSTWAGSLRSAWITISVTTSDAGGGSMSWIGWANSRRFTTDPFGPSRASDFTRPIPNGRDAMARAIKADPGRRFHVAQYRTSFNQPVFRMVPPTDVRP